MQETLSKSASTARFREAVKEAVSAADIEGDLNDALLGLEDEVSRLDVVLNQTEDLTIPEAAQRPGNPEMRSMMARYDDAESASYALFPSPGGSDGRPLDERKRKVQQSFDRAKALASELDGDISRSPLLPQAPYRGGSTTESALAELFLKVETRQARSERPPPTEPELPFPFLGTCLL